MIDIGLEHYTDALPRVSDAHLFKALRTIERDLATDKAWHAATMNEVRRRYSGLITKGISEKGEAGSHTVELAGGIEVKGEIARAIEWDSAALLDLALGMSRGEAAKLFKIEVAVPDKVFRNATGELRAALERARTEKYRPLTVKVIFPEGDAEA